MNFKLTTVYTLAAFLSTARASQASGYSVQSSPSQFNTVYLKTHCENLIVKINYKGQRLQNIYDRTTGNYNEEVFNCMSNLEEKLLQYIKIIKADVTVFNQDQNKDKNLRMLGLYEKSKKHMDSIYLSYKKLVNKAEAKMQGIEIPYLSGSDMNPVVKDCLLGGYVVDENDIEVSSYMDVSTTPEPGPFKMDDETVAEIINEITHSDVETFGSKQYAIGSTINPPSNEFSPAASFHQYTDREVSFVQEGKKYLIEYEMSKTYNMFKKNLEVEIQHAEQLLRK